jgi:hypothetical protein
LGLVDVVLGVVGDGDGDGSPLRRRQTSSPWRPPAREARPVPYTDTAQSPEEPVAVAVAVNDHVHVHVETRSG